MSNDDRILRPFATCGEMIASLADEIESRLRADIANRGIASLAVPGGTTPGPLFDTLSQADLAWERVFVTLTDERWVDPSEDGSNQKLVQQRLLRSRAAAAHFVPLMTGAATPEDGETVADAAVAAMPRPFSVVLLGMGDDGHVASLFPHAKGLEHALSAEDSRLVCAMRTDQGAVTGARISLTLKAILGSRLIAILIRGQPKLDTYRRARGGTDATAMPVRSALHQARVPVQVFWSP